MRLLATSLMLQLVFVDNLSVMMIMNFIQDSLCQKVIIILIG